MFGIIADLIASATTILLPAYLSYKALRTNDPAQTHPWLIYFTILSLTLLFESWTLFIIGWIPFYSWLRLIFLLYLVLPQTQGAKVLYLDYLEPYIVHHERQIDQFIGETHDKLQQMGLGYMNIAIEWAREKILGQKSPQGDAAQQQQAAAAAAVGGYASYASDLLSRFAMPGARTNTPTQPGTTSAGVYSMVSNFAAGLASTSGGSPPQGAAYRSAAAEAASISIPPSLFQFENIPGQSTAEKSSFITAQRDRLLGLVKMLDSEQQNLDLAYGAAPGESRTGGHSKRPSSSGSGLAMGGGLKTKSRSEQSFENVDYDEATGGSNTPAEAYDRRRTSGGVEGTSAGGSGGGGWIPSGVSGWFSGSPPRDGAEGDSGRYDRSERDMDRDRMRGSGPASRGWNAARDITDEISRGMSSGVDSLMGDYDRRRS
ncbi:uncharacterized protein Z520_10714 [Fonsecaea multimorphosa CBS 102226]|uniref:Protein YOP1 n=1 Tax=Fonsecaea multimorphosa CBS 102226 TaxID=1442371 RepID=A0A0D2I8L7_9EURO|nr:uncharacterized protein Z520_10714 [Fonsecaea multimorphosa CBS 102226]KIX93536.1 hypothetical protein Z520_10714 [Fonsecaea multimorphosa CBS 102226]OAL18851.1 hypothetical protein AYO22_10180 [Fonsecaea multimorphosa]